MKRFEAASRVAVRANVCQVLIMIASPARRKTMNSSSWELSHPAPRRGHHGACKLTVRAIGVLPFPHLQPMVPHLTTSLAGPLKELETVVLAQRPEIERWFRTQWLEHEVPFYTSVDLRNSGF